MKNIAQKKERQQNNVASISGSRKPNSMKDKARELNSVGITPEIFNQITSTRRDIDGVQFYFMPEQKKGAYALKCEGIRFVFISANYSESMQKKMIRWGLELHAKDKLSKSEGQNG